MTIPWRTLAAKVGRFLLRVGREELEKEAARQLDKERLGRPGGRLADGPSDGPSEPPGR